MSIIYQNFTILNSSNLTGSGKPTVLTPGSRDTLFVQRQLLLIFYCVLLLVTILGNLLVCAAIYCDRRLRSPTNWFIVSLAVSDLFYACLSLPFRINQLAANQAISVHACRLWIWTDMVCAAASIANLAVISVDRRLKITRPFSYHDKMTHTRAFSALAGVWTYAVVLASLSLVTWPGDRGIFALQTGGCFNQNRIFYTFAVVVGFLSPLLVLVLNYCLVYVTALNQFHKLKKLTLKATTEHRYKRRRITKDFKATKTLAVVIGTFCACWCPFFFIFTIMQYNKTMISQISPPWNEIVFTAFILVLPNLNAMCNPVIYTFFNSDFRRAFWKVLLMLFRSKDLVLYSNGHQSSISNLLYTARRRSGTLGQGGHCSYYKSCNTDGQSPRRSPAVVHAGKTFSGRGKTLSTAV